MDKAFPLECYKPKVKLTNSKPWLTTDIVNEGIFLRDLYKTFKLMVLETWMELEPLV